MALYWRQPTVALSLQSGYYSERCMYLKRLDVQGFKTFAQKTTIEFIPDSTGRRGVTAIVGPNGSGKSNTADALRWVMGEQSLKLLRGKKSEDVIFSGSDKRARSGFAEATMTLENDDKPDLNMTEVSITRRLYRDGQSEYEVNRQPARLQDVVLLLAQCGIGQRTYSVIGQGMVDQVLVASPSERKEFFDEAFGLRPFQLKRHAALNKLDASRENASQTETLLREIEPRLVSLERQVKRLEQREALEKELQGLEQVYYGREWWQLTQGIAQTTARVQSAKQQEVSLEREAKALEEELAKMEKAVPVSQGFREMRLALDALSAERQTLRERQLQLETKQAVAAVRAEKPWAPLPLSKIIETVDGLRAKHDALYALLQEEQPNLEKVRALVQELQAMSGELVGKLQRPAPEPEKGPAKDTALEKEIAEIVRALTDVATRTAETQAKIENWNKEEEGKRTHIFEVQHQLSQKRQQAQQAERQASEASVELARLETRRDGLLTELRQHAPELEKEVETWSAQPTVAEDVPTDVAARMQRVRSQLEWIGGIDPEIVKEHKDTKERFVFLTQQLEDVKAGIQALDLVIAELDATIRERSEKAFRDLDREFGIYFKKLFHGGEGKLVEVQPSLSEEEGEEGLEKEEGFSGIDIQATPPGKRFKSISLLSGGERALTSIALICAIMATNPSPFVVLDEVDAALDEANSRTFAEIIAGLADKTQFVVVTHNRNTMMQANVLYGVTMGNDGVSQLLSVKLEDVEKLKRKT